MNSTVKMQVADDPGQVQSRDATAPPPMFLETQQTADGQSRTIAIPNAMSPFNFCKFVYSNDDGTFALNGQDGRATYRYQNQDPPMDYQLTFSNTKALDADGTTVGCVVYRGVDVALYIAFSLTQVSFQNQFLTYPMFFSTDGYNFFRWRTTHGTQRTALTQADIDNIQQIVQTTNTSIGSISTASANPTATSSSDPVVTVSPQITNNPVINITITNPSGAVVSGNGSGSGSGGGIDFGQILTEILSVAGAVAEFGLTDSNFTPPTLGLADTSGAIRNAIGQMSALAAGQSQAAAVGFKVALSHQQVTTLQANLQAPDGIAKALSGNLLALPFLIQFADKLKSADSGQGARLSYTPAADTVIITANEF